MKIKIIFLCIAFLAIFIYSQLASTAGSGIMNSTSGWNNPTKFFQLQNHMATEYGQDRVSTLVSGTGKFWVLNFPIIICMGMFTILCKLAHARDKSNYSYKSLQPRHDLSAFESFSTGQGAAEIRATVIIPSSKGYCGMRRDKMSRRSGKAYDYYHYFRGVKRETRISRLTVGGL